MNVVKPLPASLRTAFTRIYHRAHLNTYTTLSPEDVDIFPPNGGYDNWLTFESDIAQIANIVVLFSESYGSMAELGAFAMVDEIASRLLVVIDDKNYRDSSFVRLGPLRLLERNYGKTAICVLNLKEIKIEKITDVSKVDIEKFYEIISSATKSRAESIKERTTFISDRAGHIIKLIVGLIQHYGALTEIEIDVLLFSMDLKVNIQKIRDYLLCAEAAEWIIKDKRGVHEYFCARPNLRQALEYRLKKDLEVDEKDRDRWRAKVALYWKENDSSRFDAIQAAMSN
jgi:hypothetical protein